MLQLKPAHCIPDDLHPLTSFQDEIDSSYKGQKNHFWRPLGLSCDLHSYHKSSIDGCQYLNRQFTFFRRYAQIIYLVVVVQMDRALFVENVKKYCVQKGIKPTVACRESGAGADLINQMERRGSIPSVERVQMLAAYLGVSTSQLLGEAPPVAGGLILSSAELDLVAAYRAADGRAREMVALALEPWLQAGEKDAKAM